MAKEKFRPEDAKSEVLYNWVIEEWSAEKLARNPLFMTECLGVLKTLKHLGYNYEWVDEKMTLLLTLMTLLR